ncbi:hypothetical protein D1007_54766 [Hordeum vulgare]|nr:hypothetical protein D1007_54766 [Hordeum vulgare]
MKPPVADGSPEMRGLGGDGAVEEGLERRRHGGAGEPRLLCSYSHLFISMMVSTESSSAAAAAIKLACKIQSEQTSGVCALVDPWRRPSGGASELVGGGWGGHKQEDDSTE